MRNKVREENQRASDGILPEAGISGKTLAGGAQKLGFLGLSGLEMPRSVHFRGVSGEDTPKSMHFWGRARCLEARSWSF